MATAVAPLLLSLLLVAAQEPATKVPPSEARNLRHGLADALSAARAFNGDYAAPAVSKALAPWTHAATRYTPEALFAVLRQGPLTGKQSASIAHHDFMSADWPLRYAVEVPKLSGAKPLAVLLDPGHSVPAQDREWNDGRREQELIGLRAVAEETGFTGCLIVRSEILERTVARGARELPSEELIARAFDDLLCDLAARYPVDPDRIYLVGTGETGTYAWYLMRALPGRWSGSIVLGASAAWAQRAISNALPVPIYAAHLLGDSQQPIAEHRLASNSLRELGGRVHFEEVQAAASGGAYGKLQEGMDWIWNQGPRIAFPDRLNHRFSTLRTPRACWIRVDALARENDGYGRSHPTAWVQAAVEGQRIRLTVENIPELTLSLAPELLDMAQPVIVEWNGARIFEAPIAPDLAGALRQVLASGDWRSCGLVYLTLTAPVQKEE